MTREDLVARVWSMAHVLREEGISYGDYLEQITYLLFLKMDDEREQSLGEVSRVPKGCRWGDFAYLSGEEQETAYRRILETLSKSDGLMGTIFAKAQNKLTTASRLTKVIGLIDRETWLGLDVDVKGDIYEGLLEKNASEVASGAGQYFTPRPLIQSIVEVVDPPIGKTIHDPACGTSGFLLAAYEHLKDKASGDREQADQLRKHTFSGTDIVADVVRLSAMNLYLHGIGGDESPVRRADALAKRGDSYDYILTNPPFGRKSSQKDIAADGTVETIKDDYARDDFRFVTSNKQLNFLQHIMSTLKVYGTAAVVLPDNVLFEAGNAGEGIRKRLLNSFNLHTILRLPTGIFYKPGVKANVLFFSHPKVDDPETATAQTDAVWYYDLRTNKHFTLKKSPLRRSDLEDFEACYKSGALHSRELSERFQKYDREELLARDKTNLDIFWLKDDSLEDIDALPPPDELAAEIVENLREALSYFDEVEADLES
ncbi:MAG: class I SAM-dependent DNA methyltransferase [Litorimonas sp.]